MTSNVGLTTSLNTLVNALQASQTSLSYLSDNISNVNTTGYTRRVVSQETQVVNGVGVGVNIADVRRSIDDSLLKTMRAQLSKTAQATTTNTYMDRLQNFTFGDPGSKFTINNALNEFYSRLETFSNNPSSAVNRNLAINSADDFANGINQLATSVQTERLNADQEIGTTINTLNDTLTNLSDINRALRDAASVGGDVNSLEDARDLQLNKVKGIVNANFTFDQYGEVSINLSNTQLLGFSQKFKISYTPAPSVNTFINNGTLNAITVTPLNASGQPQGETTTLLSGSNATTKVDGVPAGSLRALVDLRDTQLPAILKQLDTFAYTFADAFNEVHNSGSAFPPATSMTGTEPVKLSDTRFFSGQTRITLTDSNGQPVTGDYGDKVTPLLIDFSRLDGGNGFGTASVQTLIDQINNYYGAQAPNRVDVGSASNIKLGAVSNNITTVKATGSINFTATPADGDTIVINGTTVRFKTVPTGPNDVAIGGNLSNTMNSLASFLNSSSNAGIAAASYTPNGAGIDIQSKDGGTDGNAFTLDVTGASTATATGATLTGGADATGTFDFDLGFLNNSSDGSDITFDVTDLSVNGGASSAVTFDPYTQHAGDAFRTDQNNVANDTLSVNLAGLNLKEGDTFTIKATVKVTDATGAVKNEDVSFTVTVPDPNDAIKNNMYAATSISGSGDGTITTATSTDPYMKASLVDENGNTITDPNQAGFLKIETSNGDYRVSIDQLNSKDNGVYPPVAGANTATGRGLSHFFGLNNFFTFGDGLDDASQNLSVRSDILTNPALLSSGKAEQSVSTGTGNVYTYEIGSGSNESILDMLQLQDANLTFGNTGSLPELTTTVNSYATEIYNYSATQATRANDISTQANLLQTSLQTKFDDVSGVNVDEELANTIQIQNSYAAAAKVLAIVKDLFDQIEQVLS